ncbi:unnamed protein product [Didymodactylos carnosus]|uniref:Uncharacterized protein n=1 Tax=Didymodactylos carnosus TaxID=1234261 RepID=A0A8S2FC30_9BILA|nr:unnamed protein product [Didymodactylos carnosus]CAF4220739.1 unnamed protein product [Didymodactylos carnosus]
MERSASASWKSREWLYCSTFCHVIVNLDILTTSQTSGELCDSVDSVLTDRESEVFYTNNLLYKLIIIYVRQQDEREKEELVEFNKRFSLYLEYVKKLELNNSKLNLQFDEIRQQWYELFFSQYPVKFHHLRSDASQISYDKIDLEINMERLQFVSNKYLELIDTEQGWFDRKKEKYVQIEKELNKSSTDLLTLRQSYAGVEEDVKVSLAKRKAVIQNYFQVIDESYKSKSSRMKLALRVQSLKTEIPFLKNIYSISMKYRLTESSLFKLNMFGRKRLYCFETVLD